jgi:hypothetical protein
MLSNAPTPTTGADFDRPCKPWRIYMLRGGCEWVPVGEVTDRPLGENQVAMLRRIMPRARFQLVWEVGE